MISRRNFVASGSAALAAAWMGPAQANQARGASDYPQRPIKVMIGYPPGGSTDGPMRVLGDQVARRLGKAVIIENKPGAGGILPTQMLATGPSDGYTFAIAPANVFRVPFTHDLKWNPATDLTYIIGITGYSFGIVVPVDSPIHTLQDLVAYAKAHPGKLSYSSSGIATANHITMEQLAIQHGVQLNHVPYKGAADSLQAVMSGQVMACAESSAWVPHVDAGKLRLIVVWGDKRMPRYPQVPTLQEAGTPLVQNSPWGLVGPKGMPPAVVQTVHDAFKAGMDTPEFLKALAMYDMEVAYRSPQDYKAFAQSALQREETVIRQLGLLHPSKS